ncbi:F-box/FBD/LRR-repeat protein At4g26340-like [Gastrolobium bilobum]|uniref:F-box/FBD/LRR-repeat protein At4g26340-like n=1 Tax=Gastrolobium bilobum TaxID=150636 RepID=UPI002AAFD921|nr:F-box/FBD/LRR-repeat protein At4g26340-like [Gastrolobium bilobum]
MVPHLGTSPSQNFCDDSHEFYLEFELFKRFAVFVNGVLALRKARDIQRLYLSCGYAHSDPSYAISVSTWVRTAIGPHLEELRLTLNSNGGQCFVMPRTLFTCTKLVSLSLCGGIHVQQPSTVHLPSLKVLRMDIESVDSIDTLLSGCPALETLDLSFASQSLTEFRVPCSLKRMTFAVENDVGIYLEIDAPGLEYLSITQKARFFPCSIRNLQSVVDAYLDVYATGESSNVLINLLQALCGTKSLVLHHLTTKWLLRAPILDFPEFHFLLRLEIILPSFNSSFLVNLLQKCHMLQVLEIRNEREPSPLRSWVQPISVPNCVESHLTFIQFRGYQGFADELAFAGYILRTGHVLKTMIINTDIMLDLDLEKKYSVLRKLSIMPRGSSMCQLNFF